MEYEVVGVWAEGMGWVQTPWTPPPTGSAPGKQNVSPVITVNEPPLQASKEVKNTSTLLSWGKDWAREDRFLPTQPIQRLWEFNRRKWVVAEDHISYA